MNDLAYLLLLRKGDLNEAQTMASRARTLRPGVSTYHDTYARIEADLGNKDAALAAFDTALELDPINLDALIGKAFTLRQAGQTQRSDTVMARVEPLLANAPALSEPVRLQLQSLRKTTSRGE